MAKYTAERVIKLMIKKNINVSSANILILGITFKENCPDTRNSKVINMLDTLKDYKCNLEIYDPWVEKKTLPQNLQEKLIRKPKIGKYDAIVLAVGHDKFISCI